MKQIHLDISDNELARGLAGAQNENFKLVERRLGVKVGQRGSQLNVSGPDDSVQFAERLFNELMGMLRAGRTVVREDVEQAIKVLNQSPEHNLKKLEASAIYTRSGGRQIVPRSLNQQRYADMIRKNDLVFGIGPAGTGKTYLAMASAVAHLMERKVKRIVLCRPAVEAGEKLGFLPGDLAEKVNPYLRPLYDALHDMMDHERAAAMLEQGVIEVAPLAFMRGRTLNDAFAILDEAQNTTVEQMKMFLTRLGYSSKAVVTGDVTQVDLPAGKPSGLNHAQRVLKNVDGIGFCELTSTDVVRHPLVQEIIEAWDQSEENP